MGKHRFRTAPVSLVTPSSYLSIRELAELLLPLLHLCLRYLQR